MYLSGAPTPQARGFTGPLLDAQSTVMLTAVPAASTLGVFSSVSLSDDTSPVFVQATCNKVQADKSQMLLHFMGFSIEGFSIGCLNKLSFQNTKYL
jgi:hypothetical protein